MPNLKKWSYNATNEISVFYYCPIFINNDIYLNSILFNKFISNQYGSQEY